MSITIEHISKHFGAFHALNNISLTAPTGRLTSLLGPSGCGKTTLLRIIAGLENADSGRILFDGQDVTAKHVRERKVGFVFQHYALFRHMTVADNIAFGLTVLPRAQRPRIALARALAVEPKLLLLDEPFGALDAKVRKELRAWLRDIHHQLGITSILVTHDQEEALEVSDQIVVMNHGRIEQTGSADDIYLRPKNAFVTEFLGHTEAFEGRVAQGAWHYGGYARALDGQWQEQTATAYIRPHEWQIESEKPMLRGTIRALHHAGALARLTIETADGRRIRADLPAAEAACLNLQTGQTLPIAPRQIYVFGQSELIDFAI